ncbi:MAG: hypothetical protein HY901_20575, partial [Deltaproteobacteria bacterium]|nr:hypothetical protein [Deltaproteobacteria bacterium]
MLALLTACDASSNPPGSPSVRADSQISSGIALEIEDGGLAQPIVPDAGIGEVGVAAVVGGTAQLEYSARAFFGDAGVLELGRADAADDAVPPQSRFELELGDLRDVRVRLFDADGR